MSWTDRLSRASFRDFEFLTDSHDANGGRRLVVHEYPGADTPLVEDMGGKAWDWKLNAYFIGPDYDLERNGFLAKLAEPGADWLNHPWLGRLWVRARSWSVQESNEKGGFCAVGIEFVEGGETVQPTPDRVDVAYSRITTLADVAVDDFSLESMSADGMTGFLAAVQQKLETLRQAISLATLPLTWASQVQNLIAGVKNDLATLMGLPAAYATALRGLADVLGGGADDHDVADTERPRVVARISKAATARDAVKLTGVAATDGAVRRNLIREEALRSRLLVTAAAQVAMADYQAEADRDAVLGSFVTAVDTLLPSLPDEVFQAAVNARTAVIEALLAQDLKPAVTRNVVSPLPAIVLAHRLEVDESVFLARNAVRHPLFLKGTVYG
jgi:prophage DNA circulation protein